MSGESGLDIRNLPFQCHSGWHWCRWSKSAHKETLPWEMHAVMATPAQLKTQGQYVSTNPRSRGGGGRSGSCSLPAQNINSFKFLSTWKMCKGPEQTLLQENIQMAHRHMKRCSLSLIIRKPNIKTKWDITAHWSEWLSSINISTSSKCWWGCGGRGRLMYCWWEYRLVQPLRKTVWKFLKILKIELPYDPAIPLLSLYPKKPKTSIQKNTCTPMFTLVLFTVAKLRKQHSARQ